MLITTKPFISKLAFIFYVSYAFMGCTKPENTPNPSGFRLEKGRELYYEVKKENYSINNDVSIIASYVRDVVIAKEIEQLITTYTVERYVRNKTNEPWRIERVYKLVKSPAELIELGETPRLRLVFPVVNNSKFNVNLYNNLGISFATYEKLNSDFGKFKNTYRATTANDSTLINLTRIYEIYSPTEGLVYKENTDLKYCQTTPSCIGKGDITFGVREIWKRID